MNKTRLMYVFLIGSLAILTGCMKKASDEIDFGIVKDSVYQNKYFGFSVTLPSDWNIQDQETRKQLSDVGGKMLAGEDKNLKAAVKAAEMTTVNLFTTFEHPLGTPVPFNPSVICMAERIRHMPGIKRGKDYLFHAKKLLEAGQMTVFFPEEISSEQISGRAFDVMHVEIPLAGMVVRQKYYTIIIKDYVLCFIVSFTTDEEQSFLKDVLKSTSFK
ncbi:hypothetical protein ACFLS1_05490 [Verrucomicrobiota bacterium]